MFNTVGQWILVIGTIYLAGIDLGQGIELQKWNMQDYCGAHIAHDSFAGELNFNSGELPVQDGTRTDDCRVTVEPSRTVDSSSRVLFYFTSFDLPDYYKDSNVSVVNGDERGSGPIVNTDVVSGLAVTMCSTNSSLLNHVFYPNTSPGRFTVIFRRSSSGWKYPATFDLKFASYKEGPCPSDDSSVYQCSNDRCISSDLTCHEDIEACGATDENCDLLEDLKEVLNGFVKIIVDYGYLLVIVVVLYVLFRVFKQYRNRHGGCRNLPIIRHIRTFFSGIRLPRIPRMPRVSRLFSRNRRTSVDEQSNRTSPPRPSNDEQETDLDQISVASSSESSEDYSTPEEPPEPPSDAAPSYDSLYPVPFAAPSAPPEPPLPPPPSYDEVIANQDMYSHNSN